MNAPYGPPPQDPRFARQQPYSQQPYPQPHGPGGGQPPYGPPPQQAGPPPGPPRKSSTGRILLIAAAVFVVLVVVAGFAVTRLVGGIADKVGGLAGDTGAGCDAVAAADVDAALGGSYDLVQLGGGIGAMAAPVLDSRVLAGAPTTCWAVESGDSSGKLARIARYSGADATARFAQEKTTAKGTTEERGNGLSVSTDGYLGPDVQAGDEAFCTTGDMLGSAGALVRRGDTLVYVSTTAAGDGAASVPRIGVDDSGTVGFATDAANCRLAVALAAKVS
ncbi:MAG: hypothetical protein QOG20_3855 [Pseudonocardiales bacterium]|jgi:hypothetical protein|nr:hypothetical protein [Pseudonocardiales bacterium]